MRNPRILLDEWKMRFATSGARQTVDSTRTALAELDQDTRAEERAKALECKRCFYLRRSRLAGQAFTDWFCGLCGSREVWGCTHTPKVCKTCAKEHKLCTECGGDLDMRDQRRKWPTPVESPTPPVTTGDSDA